MSMNKGAREGLQGSLEQCIGIWSERTTKRKTTYVQKIDRQLAKTGLPVGTVRGLKNPVKLNISSTTLSKLKQN